MAPVRLGSVPVQFSFGGTLIGTVAGGSNGAALTVTFNASATAAAIDALIQNLTYANASDTPTASRTLTVTVTDAAAEATTRASFAAAIGTANPFNGVTVGRVSAPTLADLDGDGDLDAVVGSNGRNSELFQEYRQRHSARLHAADRRRKSVQRHQMWANGPPPRWPTSMVTAISMP